MKKIALFLVHGFLGSGKTTLIQKILREKSNLKCAVVQNEFGDIGIDGLLLERTGLKIKEVNDGSIFCSCRHDQFIEALLELGKLNINLLVIEASGISDPSVMEQDMGIIEKKRPGVYDYRGNVCIVDSENFLDLLEVMTSIERQIEYANVVLLNKIDLIDEEKKERITKRIREINASPPIIETEYADGNISFDEIAEIMSQKLPPVKPSTNTRNTRPGRITLDTSNEVDFKKSKIFFESIAPETQRIKGFIITNEGKFYVDGVSRSLKIRSVSAEHIRPYVIIILKPQMDLQILSDIRRVWSSLNEDN